jgi:hypothetical protein
MSCKHWMGLSLCVCLAACATTGQPASTASKEATSGQPPAGCVAETATRLPLTAHQCAAFGRTWTQQDIKSTGAVDVGQALSLLDPAVRSSGPP